MRKTPVSMIALLIVCAFLTQPLYAGKLKDFEEDIRKEEEDRRGSEEGDERDNAPDEYNDEDIAEALTEGLVETCVQVVVIGVGAALYYGGANSWKRMESEGTPNESDALKPRRNGDALLPFIRFDVSYQEVESDVEALDVRGEGGYGPFALQVRWTHYDEDEPDDELDAVQIHGLYRMSLSSYVELDIGLGALIIDREESHSGFSVTTPLLIHPSDYFGLEFRPGWSFVHDTTIQDYDLALMGGWRYVSVRGGYRWFESDDESLNGPYVGLSLRW